MSPVSFARAADVLPVHRFRRLVLLLLAVLVSPVQAQELDPEAAEVLLEARLEAARDSTELDEDARRRLIDLYRQSLASLESSRSSMRMADEYGEAARTAPQETARMRAELERLRSSEPAAAEDLAALSWRQLVRRLDEESANQTAVEAQIAILEAGLEVAERRPAEARQRIGAARSMMDEIAARSPAGAGAGEISQLAEAQRWATQTRFAALRAEIVMLDRELRSHRARTDLLTAQRDLAEQRIQRIAARLDLVRSAVGERRRAESELAMQEARSALAGASSSEALIRKLAEANLSLVDTLGQQLEALDDLSAKERNRVRASQVEDAYRSARRKLELAGPGTPVGRSIVEERRRFPSVREYAKERRLLLRFIAQVSLRLAEEEEERRTLGDIDRYLEGRVAESGAEGPSTAVRGDLKRLATTRRALLDRALANDNALLQRLYDRQAAMDRLAERIAAYDEFLAKRLLWVRSDPGIDAAALARLPGEIRSYVAPDRWAEVLRVGAARLLRPPVFALLLVLALLLQWFRRRVRKRLVTRGPWTVGGAEESSASTLEAVGLTVLLAAPLPLTLGALGGALATADVASAFPNAVGAALLRSAFWVTLPALISALFLPGGVADRHLGWDDAVLRTMRRHIAWFIGIGLPAYFVLRTSPVVGSPSFAGGALTFLAFVAVMGALLGLLVGTARATRETVQRLLAHRSPGARWAWQHLGVPCLATVLTGGVLLGLFGYAYSAEQVLQRIFLSIWVLTLIWLAAVLVRRWLEVSGRRLAARAHAGEAGDDAAGADAGEDPLHVVELGDDGRRLLNAAALLSVVLGLAWIWGNVVPALGILEGVSLWSHTAVINGSQETVPVTLWDLLIAAVTAIGGFVLARNLPSLLEIVLLKQGSVGAGTRYAAATLTRYTITALTMLVVLHKLGASASQLGWAAAALGVGIGFGLQEIVANFICGLILLFERPVRVGDVITLGDASGRVTKIRIRATTIRDWEQKELVIPNKELITGRLLNWTLSDPVIRVLVTVGVAYGSDVERAMALIRETAEQTPLVLTDPPPCVFFEQFGDSALILTLRAYIGDVMDRLPVTTDLHKGIDRRFREAGIVIAFPQRDVHVHTAGTAKSPAADRSDAAMPPDRK